MTTPTSRWRRALRELPDAWRWPVVGAVAMGVVAAVVGLVVGLVVYPPTAWAATVELGLPAAVLGGLLGLLARWATTTFRR